MTKPWDTATWFDVPLWLRSRLMDTWVALEKWRAAYPGRPLIIDAFCGQGGASMGYFQAGFLVVGIDNSIKQLRHYPFPFIEADVIEWLELIVKLLQPVAVVGSPPCQSRSPLKHRTGKKYPELVPPFRQLLLLLGLPYVIENVEARPDNPEAVLIDPMLLCGSMYDPPPMVDDLLLKRHRLFEAGNGLELGPYLTVDHCRGKKRVGHPWRATINVHGGGGYREGPRRPDGSRDGHGNKASAAEAKILLGIDWMTVEGMNESIPPRYSRTVGRKLMAHLEGKAAA